MDMSVGPKVGTAGTGVGTEPGRCVGLKVGAGVGAPVPSPCGAGVTGDSVGTGTEVEIGHTLPSAAPSSLYAQKKEHRVVSMEYRRRSNLTDNRLTKITHPALSFSVRTGYISQLFVKVRIKILIKPSPPALLPIRLSWIALGMS